MLVCFECWELSRRGLWDKLITLPEESYRLWCLAVCDIETSWMGRSWPTGAVAPKTNKLPYSRETVQRIRLLLRNTFMKCSSLWCIQMHQFSVIFTYTYVDTVAILLIRAVVY
jgi:hypothetical protein